MISPTESLAFSMHANPGVYALLVGSGVSRAAQIPTGWQITLDLTRKLAQLRKEPCDPDPRQWYLNAFGKEPDYSDLLDELCRTPAERQQLLRAYWEPSGEERDEGLKQPTAAHHAIAALAAQRFVRVILTTNFDRLIETALESAGVRPDVLSTPDDVRGARPLVHMPCCVIKLHGDYRDIRIRNTRDELDRYPKRFDRLLDRIFSEFGLVVCGWSAEWDVALRKALSRAPSEHFPTYWAARGDLKEEARRLVKHRRAELIPINDADEFFDGIHQHVESLQELARPHPLSTEIAVASLKRYLAEPRHQIRLSDLVHKVVEKVVETTSNGAFAGTPSRRNDNAVKRRMQDLEAACSTLLALGVTGGSWTAAEEDHVRPWERALDRLGSRDWPASDSELHLERYPAMLLLHALGLGAVDAGRLSSLGQLLETRIRTSYQEEDNAALALHPVTLSRSDPVARSTFGKRLRECLRPHARRIVPDDSRYTMIFDRLEILLGLAYCCRGGHSDTMQSGCDPFWNVPESVDGFLKEIEASLSSRGDWSPFVTSRIFGGTKEECRRRLEELRTTLRRRG